MAQSEEDSLAYFATRRDKSVVFAEGGLAAVTYRVDLGVCLASSDPIGPPDHWDAAIVAWRRLISAYGWTPAVIATAMSWYSARRSVGPRCRIVTSAP